MSSDIRNMQRRVMRDHPDFEPKPQPTIVLKGGGYRVLTATKGWRVFRAARLAAQDRMAHLLDHVLSGRPRKAAKQYRKPAPVPPSKDSRQQRRFRARKGLPNPYS